MTELFSKNFIGSKSSFERRLFLDFMKLAAEEFSSEFFTKNLYHLLNYYTKEKTREVTLTFA